MTRATGVGRGNYASNRLPKGKRVYLAALVERVATAYLAGATQREIAEREGLSQRVIHRLMRNHGVRARKAAKRNQSGSSNPRWKGDAAGYQALHLRVATLRGKPSLCVDCGTTSPDVKYEWANLTGNYADPMDYKRLCQSCHSKFDDKIRNIRGHAPNP